MSDEKWHPLEDGRECQMKNDAWARSSQSYQSKSVGGCSGISNDFRPQPAFINSPDLNIYSGEAADELATFHLSLQIKASETSSKEDQHMFGDLQFTNNKMHFTIKKRRFKLTRGSRIIQLQVPPVRRTARYTYGRPKFLPKKVLVSIFHSNFPQYFFIADVCAIYQRNQ